MVAISSDDAEAFLASQNAELSILLFFGANEGLVSERLRVAFARNSIDTNDPFQLVKLDGNEVAADPSVLVNETGTVSLFGETRAILINSGTGDFTPALELASLHRHASARLFIRAGFLKREAPLRRYCEKQKFTVAIECQPDQPSSLSQLVDTYVKDSKVSIDIDAKELLINSLGSDRLVANTEMRKLMIFADGKANITIKDVESLMADSSLSAVELVVNCAFSGNTQELEHYWNRLKITGSDSSLVLGSALREAGALHYLFSEMERGGSLEFAHKRYFNGGFNRKPISAKFLNKWSLPKCVRAIDLLSDSNKRARRESPLDQEITLRALWAIAYLVEN